jgi:hypothetical protein
MFYLSFIGFGVYIQPFYFIKFSFLMQPRIRLFKKSRFVSILSISSAQTFLKPELIDSYRSV